MKDTDKVTLTFGQLKKLIKEFKGYKKVLKEYYENDEGEVITYTDILDYLEKFYGTIEDLMDIGDFDVDRFMEYFRYPVNSENVFDAMNEMTALLIKGGNKNLERTFKMLHQKYDDKEI